MRSSAHRHRPIGRKSPVEPRQNKRPGQSTERPFIIPIFLPHAGCPHQCVFCNQLRITGEPSPLPTPEEIHDRIETFFGFRHRRSNRTEIAFYGGTFLGISPNKSTPMLSAAEAFVAAGRADGIRFSTRPDTISKKTCERLTPYTISAVEIGAQSMDDEVLRQSRRGHSAADTTLAVHLLRRKGYRVGLQLMIGLPGENDRSRQHTAEQVCRLSPDFVRIYPTLVLPESELADRYRSGEYSPMTLRAAVLAVKNFYQTLEDNHIPVIRMGLQASASMEKENAVLAGPYHPSFGHLVFSEIEYDRLCRSLEALPQRGDVLNLQVPPKRISRVQGMHKENLQRLLKRFGFQAVRAIADPAATDVEFLFSKHSEEISRRTRDEDRRRRRSARTL